MDICYKFAIYARAGLVIHQKTAFLHRTNAGCLFQRLFSLSIWCWIEPWTISEKVRLTEMTQTKGELIDRDSGANRGYDPSISSNYLT